MIVSNRKQAEEYIFGNNPNMTDARFLKHLPNYIKKYPINIAYCSDEKTGVRFGKAVCRAEKHPIKIGGGGRNKGSVSAWQLWIWDI